MSVLIIIFARPAMIWVENVLHGIILKKKSQFVNLKNPQCFLAQEQAAGGFSHAGENVAQITLFFPPGGPNPEKRRNWKQGRLQHAALDQAPQAGYVFMCSLELGHSFIQGKNKKHGPSIL